MGALVFLAPVCLVTQVSQKRLGGKEWAHPQAGGQAQGIQDYFGPNNVSGWGSPQGRTRAGRLWTTQGIGQRSGMAHTITPPPKPCKENK